MGNRTFTITIEYGKWIDEGLSLLLDRATLGAALVTFIAVLSIGLTVSSSSQADVPTRFIAPYCVPAAKRAVDMREYLRAQQYRDEDSIRDLLFDGSVFLINAGTEFICVVYTDGIFAGCRVANGIFTGESVIVPRERVKPIQSTR